MIPPTPPFFSQEYLEEVVARYHAEEAAEAAGAGLDHDGGQDEEPMSQGHDNDNGNYDAAGALPETGPEGQEETTSYASDDDDAKAMAMSETGPEGQTEDDDADAAGALPETGPVELDTDSDNDEDKLKVLKDLQHLVQELVAVHGCPDPGPRDKQVVIVRVMSHES